MFGPCSAVLLGNTVFGKPMTLLFTQPDVTTSTHPGHHLGRDKLSRRPRSLWTAAGLPSLGGRQTMQPAGKNTVHEMCDPARWG